MVGSSSATNEKIKWLEKVHDLRLMKGVLMSSKNKMMHDRDAKRQCVCELKAEVKKLKAHFAALGERCQVVESACEMKERELANIPGKVPSLEAAGDGKDRDLWKALLDRAEFEGQLGLLMSKGGCLNSNMGKGNCERFVQTTHMPTFFYPGCLSWFRRSFKTS